ncbi:MAG: ribosomal protein S18-alanine N-acetyltransferase [Chloroflexi bacterium]|nr:ribosomal protein S18-alanine N-acetyltransferase [Chloroflexota bacterium]
MLPSTPFKRDLSSSTISYLVAYELPLPGQPYSPATHVLSRANSNEATHGLRGVWKRLFQTKAGTSPPADPVEYVAGYVATWYMTDEAHITAIAVRESLRGKGLGELLLMSSIEMAMKRQSRVVTLEVRVSNKVAHSLYSKYGFSQVGLRKDYYTDNHEDAYIMTTAPISSLAYNQQFRSLEETYRTRRGNMALRLG